VLFIEGLELMSSRTRRLDATTIAALRAANPPEHEVMLWSYTGAHGSIRLGATSEGVHAALQSPAARAREATLALGYVLQDRVGLRVTHRNMGENISIDVEALTHEAQSAAAITIGVALARILATHANDPFLHIGEIDQGRAPSPPPDATYFMDDAAIFVVTARGPAILIHSCFEPNTEQTRGALLLPRVRENDRDAWRTALAQRLGLTPLWMPDELPASIAGAMERDKGVSYEGLWIVDAPADRSAWTPQVEERAIRFAQNQCSLHELGGLNGLEPPLPDAEIDDTVEAEPPAHPVSSGSVEPNAMDDGADLGVDPDVRHHKEPSRVTPATIRVNLEVEGATDVSSSHVEVAEGSDAPVDDPLNRIRARFVASEEASTALPPVDAVGAYALAIEHPGDDAARTAYLLSLLLDRPSDELETLCREAPSLLISLTDARQIRRIDSVVRPATHARFSARPVD